MLTISKPLSAGQAHRYHQEEFGNARDNYYSNADAIRGEWHGQLARQWGLEGAVESEHFRRLAEGQDPQTGEALVRHRAAGTTHRSIPTTKPSWPRRSAVTSRIDRPWNRRSPQVRRVRRSTPRSLAIPWRNRPAVRASTGSHPGRAWPSLVQQRTVLGGVQGPLAALGASPPWTPPARRAPNRPWRWPVGRGATGDRSHRARTVIASDALTAKPSTCGSQPLAFRP